MTALAERAPIREGAPARSRDWPVIIAPAALAAVLVAIEIGVRSLGFDEAASVTIAAQHGHALWRAIAHDGGNMSGYYLLLHAVIALFGRSVVVVRLPSAIAAVATVALVAQLGLRLFDRRVAVLAGVLAAVSLPLVFWGQAARGYAPMVALVTASWLCLVSRRRAAYVITTVLAVYMSFVAVLALAAQLVLWRRRDLRPLLICALGCVPLVVLAAARGSSQLFWVPRPDVSALWQVLQTLASGALPPSFHGGVGAAVVTVVTTAIVVVGARAPGSRPLVAWLLVPLVLALIESFAGQSIFVPRNLLVCLPPVALLLAVALTDPRVPVPAAVALVAALIALRAVPLVKSYGVSPENWKAATAYVVAHARRADCVAFYPSDARMPFALYGRAGHPVLPADPWGPLRPYVEDYASGRITGCPRLWLVSSHEGQPDGTATSTANYARFLALRGRFRHEGEVTFGYAAAIHVALLSGP